MKVRKRTIGVAVGALVALVMVGVGIRLSGYSEKDRETIELVEQLLKRSVGFGLVSWTFTEANVNYDGLEKRTVRGIVLKQLDMPDIGEMTRILRVEIQIERQDGEWRIVDMKEFPTSLWYRIKAYVNPLLP